MLRARTFLEVSTALVMLVTQVMVSRVRLFRVKTAQTLQKYIKLIVKTEAMRLVWQGRARAIVLLMKTGFWNFTGELAKTMLMSVQIQMWLALPKTAT
jgi:Mg2+/Co2+ transporter CorC